MRPQSLLEKCFSGKKYHPGSGERVAEAPAEEVCGSRADTEGRPGGPELPEWLMFVILGSRDSGQAGEDRLGGRHHLQIY